MTYIAHVTQDKKGNIRDYANVSQLVCLSNLENLNAVFINEGFEQRKRLEQLNQIAINQITKLITLSIILFFTTNIVAKNNYKGGKK
ncbi:FIG00897313: hypothetical protein [hydrothermal vent metagenome]|uniref:Uncharacterized protein n=1 Tax=hydrothermal vent metagenome TaxID=652676 RepID=A0A3B0VGM6_9ZZZZ